MPGVEIFSVFYEYMTDMLVTSSFPPQFTSGKPL